MKYTALQDVSFYQKDYCGKLKISALMTIFEDAADKQAKEMNTDNSSLMQSGKAWILNRVIVECLKSYKDIETVKVTTYPMVASGIEFMREFAITNPNGGIIARGSSSWSLIDLNTRRLLKSVALDNYDKYAETIPMLEKTYKKARSKNNVSEIRKSYIIGRSDIDMLGHVNNTKYADYAIDCLTDDEYAQGISAFNITFMRESKIGDKLDMYVIKENNIVFIQGKLNDEAVSFAVEIELMR